MGLSVNWRQHGVKLCHLHKGKSAQTIDVHWRGAQIRKNTPAIEETSSNIPETNCYLSTKTSFKQVS